MGLRVLRQDRISCTNDDGHQGGPAIAAQDGQVQAVELTELHSAHERVRSAGHEPWPRGLEGGHQVDLEARLPQSVLYPIARLIARADDENPTGHRRLRFS
jgi:hypothetical protein